ncbi:MAG: glutamate-cysteine ligase family protein, partial [Nitrospinota bacterium]|nr:glutamate-cysteine ligase family protein [Nitrospinota bacterium]
MSGQYGMFDGVGVEVEYMIVDSATLEVKPIADKLIQTASGGSLNDFERDGAGWSNEFVLHLVELKTLLPERSIHHIAGMLHREVGEANCILASMGAHLMPGAAHPWMNPATDMNRWPHDCAEIYGAYDRIFNSRQHGYANVQSVHMNLPFKDDNEFGRICAATRLLLPIIPALAAASPFIEGRFSGALDYRMTAYAQNSRQVPQVAGDIIPEPVFSIGEYHDRIFGPLYKAIGPLDPEGILANEWLNARGAIPRFDRSALEIRVIDVQENPFMDAGIISAVWAAIMAMVEERWISFEEQKRWATGPLKKILFDCVKSGENAIISDIGFLNAFGTKARHPMKAGDLWMEIYKDSAVASVIEEAPAKALEIILGKGSLATRILRAT